MYAYIIQSNNYKTLNQNSCFIPLSVTSPTWSIVSHSIKYWQSVSSEARPSEQTRRKRVQHVSRYVFTHTRPDLRSEAVPILSFIIFSTCFTLHVHCYAEFWTVARPEIARIVPNLFSRWLIFSHCVATSNFRVSSCLVVEPSFKIIYWISWSACLFLIYEHFYEHFII